MRSLLRTAALLTGATLASTAPLAVSQQSTQEVEERQAEIALRIKHAIIQGGLLVELLGKEKQGWPGVTAFARETLKTNPEAALLKHYRKDFPTLKKEWNAYAFNRRR